MSEEQQDVARQQALANIMEQVLVAGNLNVLSVSQRQMYYLNVCQSLGLNPMTRPFEYITVQGRMVLYARRDATDQLRSIHNVSVEIVRREKFDDVFVVTAKAVTPEGRTDESVGAVSLTGLKGEALANALMKAETKAKRRVTLSIVGLGWMDETEAESMLALGHLPKLLPEAPKKKAYEDMAEVEKLQTLGAVWMKRWQEADKRGWVEKYSLNPASFSTLPLNQAEAMVKSIGDMLKATEDAEILKYVEELARLNPMQTEGE